MFVAVNSVCFTFTSSFVIVTKSLM